MSRASNPESTKVPSWTSCVTDSSGSVLVATSLSQGIFISTDGGSSWKRSVGAPNLKWYQVTSTPSASKFAVVATGDMIYLSTNLGKTWTVSASPQGNWNSITISADGTYVFATAVGDGIYRSSDGGLNWEDSYLDPLAWRSIAVDGSGKFGVAIEIGGLVYISNDFGASWSPSEAPSMMWSHLISVSSGHFAAASVLGEGIYISKDYSKTWLKTTAPSSSWQAIACDDTGNTLAAISNEALFLSHDFGESWHQAFPSDNNEHWKSINIDSTGEIIFARTESNEFLYKSFDGGITWLKLQMTIQEESNGIFSLKNLKLSSFLTFTNLFQSNAEPGMLSWNFSFLKFFEKTLF